MFFPDLTSPDQVILSPSDLRQAAECEFALLRGLDVQLGRAAPGEQDPDPMLERVAELGDAHEQAELRRLVAAHPRPGAVVTFTRPPHTPEGLRAAHERTLAALADPSVEVVAQGTVFDGAFVGHIDFLERMTLADGSSAWIVSDTKLARSTSVPALLQVAGYADILAAAGVPLAPVARLVLGTGVSEDFRLDEIVPVFRARRGRLEEMVRGHVERGEPIGWGADWAVACGRCETCEAEVVAHDDLLLVAGMRRPIRRHLIEAGITTMTELAESTQDVDDILPNRLERLRHQARLQVAARAAGGGLTHEVVDETILALLPPASAGDIFFDFEGDPIWVEPGDPTWGLEYLFGLVEVDELAPTADDPTAGARFRAFWAHDRLQERQALIDFVTYVEERRKRWPDLHIYHYAPYETAALTRLAARHGVCEEEIDNFLRAGLFIDLYATVRGAVRVSDRSYSLKKLEPLYMQARDAHVTNAADSIVVYHQFMAARDAGRLSEAGRLLADIEAYNTDDCLSTMLLARWLRGLLTRPREELVPAPGEDGSSASTSSATRAELVDLELSLRALIDGVKPGERSADQEATALAASAILFHAREAKPGWQQYFDRLRRPTREWRGAREPLFVVDSARIESDWVKDPGNARKKPRRRLVLEGESLGGEPISPRTRGLRAVYAAPTPAGVQLTPEACNGVSGSGLEVVDATEEAVGTRRLRQRLVVDEICPGTSGHEALPVALVANDTIGPGSITGALTDLAEEVRTGYPQMPALAGVDVLRRVPPRLSGGGSLPSPGEGEDRFICAIGDALLGMDNSYVAVQGPPGTGKTYVGGKVIAHLVREHGWKVGVCSQAHKAIENILSSVINAGVPPRQVGKHTKATEDPSWTDLPDANALRSFIDDLAAEDPAAGYVVGGTAWDLTNTKRIGRGELDLVVIDEAGQYSLANTLAVSMAGQRLLLLGDPAQLPQVSTGSHPDPVDTSALGWLLPADPAEGRILPSTHGYFLERTWRLHPDLVAPLSRLAYDGELVAQDGAGDARFLDGLEPGLHVRLVDHHDNSTASVEEAEAVVEIVGGLMGSTWHDPSEKDRHGVAVGPRALRADDVIVITPYNHQLGVIRTALDDAGLRDVPVGTVDKFQGQEAAVAILSMAASSHSDVSRGMGFLLDRGRLNVALSRGKWAAIIVRSPALTDFAPRSTGELVALGAFLTLGESAHLHA